jgi:hypothetical protein
VTLAARDDVCAHPPVSLIRMGRVQRYSSHRCGLFVGMAVRENSPVRAAEPSISLPPEKLLADRRCRVESSRVVDHAVSAQPRHEVPFRGRQILQAKATLAVDRLYRAELARHPVREWVGQSGHWAISNCFAVTVQWTFSRVDLCRKGCCIRASTE